MRVDKGTSWDALYYYLCWNSLTLGLFQGYFRWETDKQDTVGLSLYKDIWPTLGT